MRDYLAILGARKWVVIALVATTTATAAFYSYRQTPVYTASAEVVVRPIRFDPNQPPTSLGAANMQTEQRLAGSATVADLAAEQLARHGVDPGAVSVSVVEGAETLIFESSSSDPASARWTAQAYAEAYLANRRAQALTQLEDARAQYENSLEEIELELRNIERQIRLDPDMASVLSQRYGALVVEQGAVARELDSFVTPETIDVGEVIQGADLPTFPSAPAHTRDVGFGFVIGLALGVAAAFALDRLDDRLRGRSELELRSGAPVLAMIPRTRNPQPPPVTIEEPMSDAAESFKALRVRFVHVASGHKVKSIVITSSLDGEGKTSMTANLGVALAIGGKRTVIVAADLRRPTLQTYFAAGAKPGLTDVLTGSHRTFDVLQSTGIENLWLVESGTGTHSVGPLELLESEGMRQVMAELRSAADFVLVDTPPVLTAPDVSALAPLADGVLFVVDPNRLDRVVLEQARHELHQMDLSLIGVVVNNYRPKTFRAYGTAYGYYSHGADGAAQGVVE